MSQYRSMWSNHVDFPNPPLCRECIIPLAVTACKEAWDKLMRYCEHNHDPKSDETCEHYKADPEDFIVKRVLRAGMNPIDAGYRYCLEAV